MIIYMGGLKKLLGKGGKKGEGKKGKKGKGGSGSKAENKKGKMQPFLYVGIGILVIALLFFGYKMLSGNADDDDDYDY